MLCRLTLQGFRCGCGVAGLADRNRRRHIQKRTAKGLRYKFPKMGFFDRSESAASGLDGDGRVLRMRDGVGVEPRICFLAMLKPRHDKAEIENVWKLGRDAAH